MLLQPYRMKELQFAWCNRDPTYDTEDGTTFLMVEMSKAIVLNRLSSLARELKIFRH